MKCQTTRCKQGMITRGQQLEICNRLSKLEGRSGGGSPCFDGRLVKPNWVLGEAR